MPMEVAHSLSSPANPSPHASAAFCEHYDSTAVFSTVHAGNSQLKTCTAAPASGLLVVGPALLSFQVGLQYLVDPNVLPAATAAGFTFR